MDSLLLMKSFLILCRLGYTNIDATTAAIKFNDAVLQRKKCEVASLSDVYACVEFGAQLANQNASGRYGFAAKSFYAMSPTVAVATISC